MLVRYPLQAIPMRNNIRTITLITLLLLPTSTHHVVGLCVGVSVQLGDDQSLRQPG